MEVPQPVVAPPTAHRQEVAFFDSDNTLIDSYSALAFYRHRLGRFEIGPVKAAQLLSVGLRGDV
ncbi:hypothetical protein [Protofrankia symbiont of Coriaria ruscifolia]|uniref:Uncharacterized protein n=1 Tax=Candidatus Protofrankia californiensis TaxID=1839754 RepID=A0A1C3NTG3_9ACTN|nr:hypothetical protein [Protofrankia symbiont of Coriaria ruscifolia]SBW17787.1 hypothetical protein FDG2_0372 [Candidatus Protofrankia californiensis]